MHFERRSFALGCLCALTTLVASGCGGATVRSSPAGIPRLAAQRLGSIRCAMTYDGDWLGGMPPLTSLGDDLDLAARRGVQVVVDLRSMHVRSAVPLDALAAASGIELIEVDLRDVGAGAGGRDDWPAAQELITPEAIDQVRTILKSPGRRRALLLDDDGTVASMIYAIHLTVDEGWAESQALRAARATGLSQANEIFVKEQVSRIRENAS